MKKILTYGTFDTFHYGHIKLLERAKALGDYLVVGLSTDEFNDLKGKKAFHSYEERLANLKACRFVDEVIPERNWEQKIDDVRDNDISVFVMGDDWAGKFDFLKRYCSVTYLTRTPSISSTLIRGGVKESDKFSAPETPVASAAQPTGRPAAKKQRVLVFPCGSESGLEIHAALKYEKHIELYGASSVDDHGRLVFKNYTGGLPFISAPDFIEKFNAIVRENEIDWIFPAYDDVLLFLSENREKLSAQLLTSSREVVAITRSKRRTYEALAGLPFVPRYYTSVQEVETLPVFLKPECGQGSQGIFLAKTRDKLDSFLNLNPDHLICEYLPGEEFTVDCFSNSKGQTVFSGARRRARVKAGISVATYPVDLEKEVKPICDAIMSRLPFRGAWFFQVKRAAGGELKLLEAAPRIAGSMGGFRNWGVNFAALTVYDFSGHDVEIIRNPHSFMMDRSFVSRYELSLNYARVYIDLDDTITHGGYANEFVMMFLYSCRKAGKEIVLVTRHAKDVSQTLKQSDIAESIFHKIIHLKAGEAKSSIIEKDKTSIFIDDSFTERKDVSEKTGIPVFSVDAVECLVDWRM